MKYLFLYSGKLFMAFVWLICQAFVFLWHLDVKHFSPIGEFCSKGVFGSLQWTIIFLVTAIVCAIFGFGLYPDPKDAVPAKILFFIFLVLFVLSLIAGGFRRVD
jgi:uncharacterized membrane protein YtjA (UPF0391 family)